MVDSSIISAWNDPVILGLIEGTEIMNDVVMDAKSARPFLYTQRARRV